MGKESRTFQETRVVQRSGKAFYGVCLNAKKIDEDQELIADLENKRHGVGSAFWLRVSTFIHIP